jgi:hypothetical protein
MGGGEMAYPIVSESAKVTDDRHEKNIIAPRLAGVDRLIAQRLLMGFWHASDDIVGWWETSASRPAQPSTRSKIVRVWCSRPSPSPPHTVLCQINVHPGGCSVETAVSFQTRYGWACLKERRTASLEWFPGGFQGAREQYGIAHTPYGLSCTSQ